MRRPRLDLAALRTRRWPRLTRTGFSAIDLLDNQSRLSLTRREMLGLAGTAAATLPLKLGASEGRLQFVPGRKRVAFRLDGRERWVIDTRRFAGTPVLRVSQSKKLVRVALINARYPGTNVPADMECKLERVPSGWRMHLRMALGGFGGEAPFERWLRGKAELRSAVQLDKRIAGLGDSSSLMLVGRARAEFLPTWTLHLEGKGIARLKGFGGETVADSLVVALLDPAETSIARKPRERRTLLAMNRGNRPWPFQPLLGRENQPNLVVSDSAFDRIRIETGEDVGGGASRILLADSQSGQPGIEFIPDGDLGSGDGTPFRLPLRNARYAITADSSGQHSALVADHAGDSTWVHAEGCSFEIGGSGDVPAFEAVSVNGQSPRVRCTPALKQIAAPLPGVIVQARPVKNGTQLAFLAQNETRRVIIRRQQTTERPVQQPKQQKQIRIPNIRLGTIRAVRGKRKAKKKKGLAAKVIRQQYGPSFTFDLIRPDDLLALTLDFYNMSLAAGGGAPRLVREDPNQPAYLVVHFGPQHVAEQAFYETNQPAPLPKKAEPPVGARLAGASRLAFIVPNDVAEIPYTLESLLNWAQFEQSVTPLATPPIHLMAGHAMSAGPERRSREPQVQAIQQSPQYYQQVAPPPTAAPAPVVSNRKKKKKKGRNRRAVIQAQHQYFQLNQVKEPESYQTAIEAPYRMILSPSYYAGWAHSAKAVEHGGAFELWHTRLGVRAQQGVVDEQDDFYRTVRAVWATDYPAQPCLPVEDSTPTTLSTPAIRTQDRYEIVRLSSDPTMTTFSNRRYVPLPIQVNRLMLSTLGAWVNTNGVWEPPKDVRRPGCPDNKLIFDLESWRHIASMGRDQYVRIVKQGYLCPFGHRAVWIIITERKFNRTPSGKMAAYLRQQQFVVVREHEKTYPAVGQQHPHGPKLPFQAVRINTLSTPALDVPPHDISGVSGAFWPQVESEDFLFKMTGVDWEGNTAEFTAPLIFVDAIPAGQTKPAKQVVADYNSPGNAPRRLCRFSGQKVAYAKNKVPGDTTLETDSMSFLAENPETGASVPTSQALFYPAIANSAVRIATVEQLTGRNASTSIEYHDTYLHNGIEAAANAGQLFAKLADSVPLAFGGAEGGADKVGGLLTPNMDISGLSRLLGPVAGKLGPIAAGNFDPKQFFNTALDAKLLGDISLADVIQTVTNFQSDVNKVKKIPKFITSHLKDAIEVSFTWEPDIQDVKAKVVKDGKTTETKGGPFFVAKSDPTKTTKPLTVSAKLTKRLDGKPPNYEVNAVMTNFEIHLVPAVVKVLIIKFNELSFTSLNGKKPDVNADLSGVEFTGPLTFVNTLQNLIPTDGFKDPPSLHVTAEGIEAGYSLGLPPASVGVFNLSNVSLAAKLNIYFTGKPITFEFDFCQEHQPFLLTVSLFGGGGYFGLTATPAGIQRMAAEFEFGGSFSLNIGVASGGVYLMAGFNYTHENGDTKLSGYLRCGGALEVLAIITVSVEFKMGLTYVPQGNKVWGRATLTVEVKIAFFSKSVHLTVERQFSGGHTQESALFGAGAPYPVGPTGVQFADEMSAIDWQLYCEAFA